MENVIFQASDLARDRTRFLDAARAGRAVVRDKDGTGLVMLPESELVVLEGYAAWSQRLNRLSALIESERPLTAAMLGELAWLRVFDVEDLREFVDELHTALIAGLADQSLEEIEHLVRDWRITARQLEDPLRRSVLLGRDAADHLVDAAVPVEHA
jgi:hypothetical protein